MLEDRLYNFDDIVFSCVLPDDWLNEVRMPQHVLVYVYDTFIAYMVIAALGNVVGFLMDRFEPEHIDGLQIYGRDSYLLSFGVLLVISLFAVYSAFLSAQFCIRYSLGVIPTTRLNMRLRC